MLNYEYPNSVLQQLQQALSNDLSFKFKLQGRILRYGICPNCNQKKCFVSIDKPGRVSCGSLNCGWTETTRNLYPHVFEVDPSKYDDQNFTAADAYMSINRAFELSKIKGWYKLGHKKVNGTWRETVRVELWDGHYWERIISPSAVRENQGRKAMFSAGSQGKIRGNAWAPPNLEIQTNDPIIMTEGIFKSIAWNLIGYKSISGMSAGNLPFNFIKQHINKNILWILALDKDPAGFNSSAKFRKFMRENHPEERFLIAFPPSKQYDWDDLYRQNNLHENMLKDSIHRGHVYMAESAHEKAAWIYSKKPFSYFHVEFKNKLYSYAVALSQDEQSSLVNDIDGLEQKIDLKFFSNCVEKRERISNTAADFLYYERDAVTGDLTYFFKVPIDDKGKWQKLSIAGSLAATPDSWNKTLMEKTEGRNFRGSKTDLNMLHDLWFERTASYVRSLPFVGYDKITKAYVFYSWGAYNNRIIKPNNHDYFTAGKEHVKCKTSVREENRTDKFLAPEGDFNPDWIKAYRTAFDINGMVALAWWTGTLFSEQIRALYGYWPIIELSGEQGTGKTQMIEFLWRCCGRPEYEGFDPSKSTPVGRARTFMKVSNLPVVLLEGDRENGRGNWDYNELKMLYNGRFGRAIGMRTQGNETIDSTFRGGIMIAQNATIQTDSEAVLARLIHVHCTKDHFTKEGSELSLELNRMATEELCPFISAVLQKEHKLFDAFKKEFEKIDDAWVNNNRHIQNRIIHNHAMVFAWVKVLPLIFGKAFQKEWIPELEDYILARAVDRQKRCTEEHPQISQFWEQYEYIQTLHHDNGIAKNILNHSKSTDLIAVNLVHYQQVLHNQRLDIIPLNDLKRILPESRKYKFLHKNKATNSALNGFKSVKCWVFQKPQNDN